MQIYHARCMLMPPQGPYHWQRGLDAPRPAPPASEAGLWLRPGRTLHGLLRYRGPLHNQRSADQAPDVALVVDEHGTAWRTVTALWCISWVAIAGPGRGSTPAVQNAALISLIMISAGNFRTALQGWTVCRWRAVSTHQWCVAQGADTLLSCPYLPLCSLPGPPTNRPLYWQGLLRTRHLL
jgi:hypothetical protein